MGSHFSNLITSYKEPSPFAEAYRILRTNLTLGNGQEAPRVIAVTGARPGQGASTTAANLAISLAEVWRRVLLVDGNLRRPILHRYFDIPQSPGLVEVAGGEVLLPKAVAKTAVDGLSVLPSGKALANPTPLVAGLRPLLVQMREAYDMVVVDTPAGVVFPDAVVLAAQAEGVIMIVRAGQSSSLAVSELRRRLLQAHANVLGTVLNKVRPEDAESLSFYREYAATR